MPFWADDKIAAMLEVGHLGCRRCGRGAIAERDRLAAEGLVSRSEYAEGGLVSGQVSGQQVQMRIERVGSTLDGLCLYRIDGGPPEIILTKKEAGAVVARAFRRDRGSK